MVMSENDKENKEIQKMDAQFFTQMNRICHQIYHTGCRKLFLYPFGYRAMEIYEFLNFPSRYF